MSFVPSVKLYASDGVTLTYTFPLVQSVNCPKTIKKNYIVEAKRGNGGIIIPGSDAMWDLEVKGFLVDEDYSAIIAKIDAMESAIVLFTQYIIKIDKTISTTYSYNVKRVIDIQYPENLRCYDQEYLVTFKANAW